MQTAIVFFERHLWEEGKSKHTRAAYVRDLKLLAEWCGPSTSVGRLDYAALSKFFTWMEHKRNVPCSRKTYARRVTAVKSFFGWLKELGAISLDPSLNIKQRSGQAPLQRILTPAQINACKRVYDPVLSDDQNYTTHGFLFHLFLHTGIKLSELLRLSPADVVLHPGGWVEVSIDGSGKYLDRRRTLRVSDNHTNLTAFLYHAYKDDNSAFFRFCDLSPRQVQALIQKVGKLAGLSFKVSPEILRWTFAVNLKRVGVPDERIRTSLGVSVIHFTEVINKIRRLEKQYYPPPSVS